MKFVWTTENLKITDDGYTRVTFPEMIGREENAKIKLIVDKIGPTSC